MSERGIVERVTGNVTQAMRWPNGTKAVGKRIAQYMVSCNAGVLIIIMGVLECVVIVKRVSEGKETLIQGLMGLIRAIVKMVAMGVIFAFLCEQLPMGDTLMFNITMCMACSFYCDTIGDLNDLFFG